MPRPDLQKLYQTLAGNRLSFIRKGEYHLHEIYNAVRQSYQELCDDNYLCSENCSSGHNQPEWNHVVRRVLEELKSADGDVTRSGRHGYWAFNDGDVFPDLSIPVEQAAGRVQQQIFRIIRDTALTKRIKALHKNTCQLCGFRIELRNGGFYSEAHHIQPLGEPHNGPDLASNVIVLCPNHHAICDYGAMLLDLRQIRSHPSHEIDERFIDYHNRIIVGPELPDLVAGPIQSRFTV